MKKFLCMVMAALSLYGGRAAAADKLQLTTIGQEFQADVINGLNPIAGTDQYARITDDGQKIVQHSFATGRQTAVLFDVQNTMGEKIDKVDGYILSPDGTKMLIQANTEYVYRHSFLADWYIYTMKSHKLERLSEGGKQQVPQFSPDGNLIGFVREGNLFLIKLLYDNAESQVTKDGKFGSIINGIPDWVNEEEFSLNTAWCFNADGTKMCWLRYDETAVPQYSRQMYKGQEPAYAEYNDYPGCDIYKYPKAGQQNAAVTAWSFDIKSRRTQQLQVPLDSDGYMPRIKTTSNPDKILIYTLNRHQDNFCIYGVNPSSTMANLLVQEKTDKYICEGIIDAVKVGKNSILVPSDRDGFRHLFIYNMNGQQIRKVGTGEENITSVYGYNELTGDVYYQVATKAYDRQVFVNQKNGKTLKLTAKEGWNDALFSGDYKYFVNTWSDMNTPYVTTVCNNLGKTLSTTIDNKETKARLAAAGYNRRELFTLTTSEGVTLNGWMLKPADFSPSKKYPVIMHQYSGPGSQQVVNSWRCGSMGQGFDYYLAQEGYIVVCVDGRGTGGRGEKFEKCTYRNLGVIESKDQVEAALWLGKQSYVDSSRIGIWGWSFGGFNTLMSMSEGRGVFACGVAIAPPTNWKYYDTIYTERYMRTPQENPAGYDVNPIGRVNKLHGALLLCHGMADDNVHPQNMFEYTEALVQADKDFYELLYTNRNHSIRGGNTRNHLMRNVVKWFDTYLK